MDNPAEIAILILTFWAVVATYYALRFNKEAEENYIKLLESTMKLDKLADLQRELVSGMETTVADLGYVENTGFIFPSLRRNTIRNNAVIFADGTPQELSETAKAIQASYAAVYEEINNQND